MSISPVRSGLGSGPSIVSSRRTDCGLAGPLTMGFSFPLGSAKLAMAIAVVAFALGISIGTSYAATCTSPGLFPRISPELPSGSLVKWQETLKVRVDGGDTDVTQAEIKRESRTASQTLVIETFEKGPLVSEHEHFFRRQLLVESGTQGGTVNQKVLRLDEGRNKITVTAWTTNGGCNSHEFSVIGLKGNILALVIGIKDYSLPPGEDEKGKVRTKAQRPVPRASAHHVGDRGGPKRPPRRSKPPREQ